MAHKKPPAQKPTTQKQTKASYAQMTEPKTIMTQSQSSKPQLVLPKLSWYELVTQEKNAEKSQEKPQSSPLSTK